MVLLLGGYGILRDNGRVQRGKKYRAFERESRAIENTKGS